MCVACLVALTRVSGVATTPIRRKGKGIRDDEESERFEGRSSETLQNATKSPRSRVSSRRRGARH